MSTRDELAKAIRRHVVDIDEPMRAPERAADAVLAHLAAEGMVVLGPDGEPLKVTPLLRALGREAKRWDRDPIRWLMRNGVDRPLADACAAAEVEG